MVVAGGRLAMATVLCVADWVVNVEKDMRNLVEALVVVACLCGGMCWAVDPVSVPVSGVIRDHVPKEIRVPDILGMKALKCDLHMHTVFSDGNVWPTKRVEEAWREGLDAIAITDHIEEQPSKQHLGGDKNSSYEVALSRAEERGLLLIRGGEISRYPPEGHYNALFLNDVNAIDVEDFMSAMEAAIDQGAFIQWNHPAGWGQTPGDPVWTDIQEQLYEKGWLHGVEVFNHNEWYPMALGWCLDKKLAAAANSDIHGIVSERYDTECGHRPLTLVFAKERSVDGVREALFARRSVAWFGDELAGPKEYLEALFLDSVTFHLTAPAEEGGLWGVKFTNTSDIPFVIESRDPTAPGQLRVGPRGIRAVKVPTKPSGAVAIANLHTAPGEYVVTQIEPQPVATK